MFSVVTLAITLIQLSRTGPITGSVQTYAGVITHIVLIIMALSTTCLTLWLAFTITLPVGGHRFTGGVTTQKISFYAA